MSESFVILSFDDGYKLDVEIAKTIIKLRLKACFAISLRNLGREIEPSDLTLIAEAGEVLSHGILHLNLAKFSSMSSKWMLAEIRDSKKYLETLSGQKIYGFVYPYGCYNKQVLEIVREFYYYARTTDLYLLTRDAIKTILRRRRYQIPVAIVDITPSLKHIAKSVLASLPRYNRLSFILTLSQKRLREPILILYIALKFLESLNANMALRFRYPVVIIVLHSINFVQYRNYLVKFLVYLAKLNNLVTTTFRELFILTSTLS